MSWKIATVCLTLLAIMEGLMILDFLIKEGLDEPFRFQTAAPEQWGGFVALDSRSGRICRTVVVPDAAAKSSETLDFIRSLPACRDLR